MRSAIEATMPLPDQSLGMPKMPARNTSRIPTIAINFQPRFLFMKNQSFVVGRQSLAKTTAAKITAAPPSDQLLSTIDYFPSSAVVTDSADARLISSFRLLGGTRQR